MALFEWEHQVDTAQNDAGRLVENANRRGCCLLLSIGPLGNALFPLAPIFLHGNESFRNALFLFCTRFLHVINNLLVG